MKKLKNEMMVYINMLSALVSYPLFDQIYETTGNIKSIGALLKEFGTLLSNDDTNKAFLRFQHLMAAAKMKIPPEIHAVAADDIARDQFIVEFFLDLEDYYTEELELYQSSLI